MPISILAKTNLFLLLFNNVAWENFGDVAGILGSSTPGSIFLGLHYDDPTISGDQTSFELSYGGYTRVAIERTNTAWTVTAGQAVNASIIEFSEKISGADETPLYASVGRSIAGVGEIISYGAIVGGIAIENGSIPRFNAGQIVLS